jgi:hypothetical protein
MLIRVENGDLQTAGPLDPLVGRLRPGIIVPENRPEQGGQPNFRIIDFPGYCAQTAKYIGNFHAAGTVCFTLGASGAQPQAAVSSMQAKLSLVEQSAYG